MEKWIETILTLGGGAILLELSRWIGQAIADKGKRREKLTKDETELSKILLDHNQLRYDAVLKDIQDSRTREGNLEDKVRHLELENLHARHLLGIGPVEPLPMTREIFLKTITERGIA